MDCVFIFFPHPLCNIDYLPSLWLYKGMVFAIHDIWLSHLEHWWVLINPLRASHVYIWELNFVTTVPADVSAPNGARPSAGTMLNEELDKFTSKFIWLSMIAYHFYWYDNIIQTDQI